MKNFNIFLFVSLLAVLLFTTCKSEEEEPLPNGVKISEKAKVISESNWNQNFVAIDSANYTLTFGRNTEIEQYKPGDIIVSAAGEGLLRKVKSVQVVNDQVVVITENATLTDLIEEGLVDFRQQLTHSQIKSVQYHYEGIYLDTVNYKSNSEVFSWPINIVLFDLDGNPQTTNDQIRIVGAFDCDWTFIAKIDIGLTQGLKEVKFGFESNESLNLQLLAGLQYNFEKKKTLATVNFTPIVVVVGVVPLVFTPQLKIILGVDGYANASITTEITQSIEFEAGLQWLKNAGWSSYSNLDKSFNFQPPQLTANAGATGYVKPEMAVKLYGIVGPYANLKLYGKLNANLLQTPWWKLYAGIKMAAGVKIEILDKFLLDFSVSDLINIEQQIAQASSLPGLTPVAAFTANPTSGTAPLAVNYTDQSANNPTSWAWDFGDGTTSTQQNPAKTYQNAGNYTVKLTATNSHGSDTHIKSNYITVNIAGAAPVAAFTANPTSGTAPLAVNFTDQSANNPTSWAWDFGDGTTSTQQNPAKTYQNAGNYTVKLTATNSHGFDEHIKSNYVAVTTGGGGTTGQPCPGTPTVTDIDGNVYNTVLIGSQCWMKDNLKATRDATGNNIIRYCYENNPDYCNLYGGLYEWVVLMNGAASSNNNPSGVQGICPTGWHVPSDAEWTQLRDYVVAQGYPNTSVTNGAGNALKSCRQVNSPLGGACNTTAHPLWNSHPTHYGFDAFGFSAFPGGDRVTNGAFYNLGSHGYWWSSTESSSSVAWYRFMLYGYGNVLRNDYGKTYGFSVRCLRD